MLQQQKRDWHIIVQDEVLARLKTRHEGLNSAEVAERFKLYGPNRLPEAGKPSLARVILRIARPRG